MNRADSRDAHNLRRKSQVWFCPHQNLLLIVCRQHSSHVTSPWERGYLTSRAEAPQRLSLGRGHVGQPQGPLVKVLVGEEVGQAHGGRVVRDVRAELLQNTTWTHTLKTKNRQHRRYIYVKTLVDLIFIFYECFKSLSISSSYGTTTLRFNRTQMLRPLEISSKPGLTLPCPSQGPPHHGSSNMILCALTSNSFLTSQTSLLSFGEPFML